MSDAAELRTLRKKLSITQGELARALECTQQTISDQERGKMPIRRERLLAVRHLAENPELLRQIGQN